MAISNDVIVLALPAITESTESNMRSLRSRGSDLIPLYPIMPSKFINVYDELFELVVEN